MKMIEKFVFCFASLGILTASALPQGINNYVQPFGRPVQAPFYGSLPSLPIPSFTQSNLASEPMISLASGMSPVQAAPVLPSTRQLPADVEEGTKDETVNLLPLHKAQSTLLKQNMDEPKLANSIPENKTLAQSDQLPSNGLSIQQKEDSNLDKEISWFNAFSRTEPTQLFSAGVAVIGAALGRDGCTAKAACLIGSLFPPVTGRDMVVATAETFAPKEWRELVRLAKSSMLQKQDCNRFSCF